MRPKKPESDLKNGIINVRLTIDEKQKLLDFCKNNDIKYGRFIRKIVREIITNEPDLVLPEMIEFKSAVRQLAGISRNLNQLTRAVNTGKIPHRLTEDSYWMSLFTHVNDIQTTLYSVIKKTENRWIG